MDKYKNIIILFNFIIILFFVGCLSKSHTILSEKNLYKDGFEHTQVSDIVFNNDTKAILNVTYLNRLKSDKYSDGYEYFLVGVYIADDKKQLGLDNGSYKLSLNEDSIYKKIYIDNSKELYQKIPIKNYYAKYYIVQFNKSSAKKLNLKYTHQTFGSIVLHYQQY